MSTLTADVASWIESVTGVAVQRAVPLVGGMSSKVHRCWCSDGSTVVLRHITDRDWLAREPYLIEQEAIALRVLAESKISAPHYLASDPVAGLLLMTFMPGVVVAGHGDLKAKAVTIGELAAQISAVPLPDDHGLNAWRSWAPANPEPPGWGDTGLWSEAIDAYENAQTPPVESPVLLHRDLHPLNILWQEGEVSAVVDWVNACVGHPHAELGHCRWNLALLAGPAAADLFLQSYLGARGEDRYDYWWDIAPAMSFLPGPFGVSGWAAVGRDDMTPAAAVAASEQFLANALSRC